MLPWCMTVSGLCRIRNISILSHPAEKCKSFLNICENYTIFAVHRYNYIGKITSDGCGIVSTLFDCLSDGIYVCDILHQHMYPNTGAGIIHMLLAHKCTLYFMDVIYIIVHIFTNDALIKHKRSSILYHIGCALVSRIRLP